MTPSFALAAAGVFAIVLLLLRSRDGEANSRANDGANYGIPAQFAAGLPPVELAARIFSQQDKEFIVQIDSPGLQQLYREERRRVALHWVKRTSRQVSQVMRRHRLSSRESANLNAAMETRLFFQYIELRFLCAALLLMIQLLGPHALVNLAAHAGELYQRIERTLSGVGVGQLAPPRNLAA
jgi:hypothetical protein